MWIVNFLLNASIFVVGLFLILLVLVQRGRGGGLAGALGGMGGQSAFGTKAGDVFTKVTIVTAAVWILLCAGAIKWYKPSPEDEALFKNASGPQMNVPVTNPATPVPTATTTATGETSGSAPSGATSPAAPPAQTPPATPSTPPASTAPASTPTGAGS